MCLYGQWNVINDHKAAITDKMNQREKAKYCSQNLTMMKNPLQTVVEAMFDEQTLMNITLVLSPTTLRNQGQSQKDKFQVLSSLRMATNSNNG